MPLPKTKKQVIRNLEGIAKLELDIYIVNPTTLYFDAFIIDGIIVFGRVLSAH